MEMIDAHIHVNGDDAETRSLFADLGVKLLNICVAIGDWQATVRPAFRQLARRFPDRFAWCTTFALPTFDENGKPEAEYAEQVLKDIEQDVEDGAVAVKAWKNIGMELARPGGEMVLIDDGIFDPIFEYCAANEIPMIMHIGEPRACWRPLSEPSPHAAYYRNHPEWHMHGRTDMPSHGDLIDARDRVLANHPRLRVVGAHLGSLEYDVAEVAARLDRFPNFAVDVSARLGDLLAQPSSTVREFFLTYPDRVLFGTDLVATNPTSQRPPGERAGLHQSLRGTYDAYTRYFESSDVIEYAGESAQGVALPEHVLNKVYRDNARTWYPGIAGPSGAG